MLKEIKESLEVFEEEVDKGYIDVYYNGDVDKFIKEEQFNLTNTGKDIDRMFNELKKEKNDVNITVNVNEMNYISLYKFKEKYVKEQLEKRLRRKVKNLQEKLKEKLDK